jgi:MFS family permease
VFGAELASASLGLVTLFLGIGQAVGPVVAGRLADASSSFASSYALAAGLFVAGAIVAVFLRERGPAPECPVPAPVSSTKPRSPGAYVPLVGRQEVSS